MTRINHIAIKVDDLQAATDLYENVFGLKYVSTVQSVGHISRHLSDGVMGVRLKTWTGLCRKSEIFSVF